LRQRISCGGARLTLAHKNGETARPNKLFRFFDKRKAENGLILRRNDCILMRTLFIQSFFKRKERLKWL